MGFAVAVGFGLGITAGGRVLPVELNWLFAGLFGLFFGTLAFVFTGMKVRRDRGVVSETFMVIPSRVAGSLKLCIQEANQPTYLSLLQISKLDSDMAELDELEKLLKLQPKAGTNPALKARLEELAAEWLDYDKLEAWLTSVEPEIGSE